MIKHCQLQVFPDVFFSIYSHLICKVREKKNQNATFIFRSIMSRVVIFLAVCLAVVMAVQSGKFVFSNFIGCGFCVKPSDLLCKKMNYLVYFMDSRLLFFVGGAII